MLNRSVQSLASRRLFSRGTWRRACAILAVPSALVAWSSTASAQGWLADRRYTEGAGIRAGDLELHPGIGGEVGYDTNWFLRSSKSGANLANGAPRAPVRDAAVFRITPSFYISTLGTQRQDGKPEPRTVSFRGGISATGRAFIGEGMSKQHNVGLAADARLDINQGRPIAFGVFTGWNRVIQPQVLGNPDQSFNRDDVRGGLEIIGMPGGGTLDLRGGYQVNAVLFEESNGVPYNNLNHEVYFKDRWRFRPRTALFHDTGLRFVTYPNAARASNYLNDSTPVRTRLGLTGLLTERFGALIAAGYGATFFQNPTAATSRQYDSINAQVEGTFYLGQGAAADEPGKATLLLSTVSLGYVRDFQNSYLANYYASNKGYGRLEYWFGGKVLLRLDAYLEQLSYPPVFINPGGNAPPNQVTGEFSNLRWGAGLFAEYRITAAFGINTTVEYVQQSSSTLLPVGSTGVVGGPVAPTQLFFDQNYMRVQAFAGARYFF